MPQAMSCHQSPNTKDIGPKDRLAIIWRQLKHFPIDQMRNHCLTGSMPLLLPSLLLSSGSRRARWRQDPPPTMRLTLKKPLRLMVQRPARERQAEARARVEASGEGVGVQGCRGDEAEGDRRHVRQKRGQGTVIHTPPWAIWSRKQPNPPANRVISISTR